jgi:hypothetical protein
VLGASERGLRGWEELLNTEAMSEEVGEVEEDALMAEVVEGEAGEAGERDEGETEADAFELTVEVAGDVGLASDGWGE